MRIYSMTATFGKLENQTLTFKPGLNVIHAPNEGGKSTWCAFIIAMLYGINTRESTRLAHNALADKDHYMPWSGSPMSGRMDINWNGRDITIVRKATRTNPLGDFQAFETVSGLPVTELNGTNCGDMLLGVEKSVFTRSSFIRMTDLPVTADESLRRRLNALVTTGDESGASDALYAKLHKLENTCRSNRVKGLLPEAEAKRDQLTRSLQELRQLELRCQEFRQKQASLAEEVRLLKNHRDALDYADAQESNRRIADAIAARDAAKAALEEAQQACAQLPTEEDANATLQQLEQLQLRWNTQQSEPLPVMPEPVNAPAPFIGLTGEQATAQAEADFESFTALSGKQSPLLLILAILCGVIGIACLAFMWYLAIPFVLVAAVLLFLHFGKQNKQNQQKQTILSRYGVIPSAEWIPLAKGYQEALVNWQNASAVYKQQSADIQQRRDALTQQTQLVTQGQPISACISSWKSILAKFDVLRDAQRTWEQADHHAEALAQLAKPVAPPEFEDTLTLSRTETENTLAAKLREQKNLDFQLAQSQGLMQSMGSAEDLERDLAAVNKRIEKLEQTHAALVLAQDILKKASDELQRRFAPKLTHAAQDLFGKLTGGRYNQVIMDHNFAMQATAEGETAPTSILYRSDGTTDQLYLALRLAVSKELIPEAPLVLDDAMVRFDDDRLALAMGILQEESKDRQVILFTCQTREIPYGA